MDKLLYVSVVCCLAGLLADQGAVLCSGSRAPRWRLSAWFGGQGRADDDESDNGGSSLPGAPAGEGFVYASGSEYRRWSRRNSELPARGAEGGSHTQGLRGAVGPEESKECRRHSLYAGASGSTRDSSGGERQQRGPPHLGSSRSCANLARASTSTEREGDAGSETSNSCVPRRPLSGRSHSSLRDTQDESEPCMRRTKSDSATKMSSAPGRSSTVILRAMQKFRRQSDSRDAGGLRARVFDWLAAWHRLNPDDLQRLELSSSSGAYVMVLHSTGETHTLFRTQADFEEKEKLDQMMEVSMPRAIGKARKLALVDWVQRREILVGHWPSGSESNQ